VSLVLYWNKVYAFYKKTAKLKLQMYVACFMQRFDIWLCFVYLLSMYVMLNLHADLGPGLIMLKCGIDGSSVKMN
jgi:hypothetical protein